MVVHKRLFIQPCTYHKLERIFHCSLLLFLAIVLNFIWIAYEYEYEYEYFILVNDFKYLKRCCSLKNIKYIRRASKNFLRNLKHGISVSRPTSGWEAHS